MSAGVNFPNRTSLSSALTCWSSLSSAATLHRRFSLCCEETCTEWCGGGEQQLLTEARHIKEGDTSKKSGEVFLHRHAPFIKAIEFPVAVVLCYILCGSVVLSC